MVDDQNTVANTPSSATAESSGTDKYGRQLYKAVCAKCGGEALVPFQPTSGRPVYCKNCYQPRSRRDFGGNRANRSFSDRNH